MLRLLVLLLVVANLGYWAWADGHLRELGLGPPVEREPERVARQLHPEALKVEPLATSSAPPTSRRISSGSAVPAMRESSGQPLQNALPDRFPGLCRSVRCARLTAAEAHLYSAVASLIPSCSASGHPSGVIQPVRVVHCL